MAVPVARVHLAMAHAALPGLLPTPPAWNTTVPLLPTPSCANAAAFVVLPNEPPSKTGRVDAVDRWDACKKRLNESSSSSSKPGRADAAERWDARKMMTTRSSSGHQSSPDGKKNSSSSPGRASSSCERWDVNKKSTSATSSSSSSNSSSISSRTSEAASSSCERWDGNKRPVDSRGSSSAEPERWDAHKKKPRPPPQADVFDDGESSTGSNDMEVLVDYKPPQPQLLMTAPGFIAAPEPSMLPIPSFSVLHRRVVT